jgi:hypothetical protein
MPKTRRQPPRLTSMITRRRVLNAFVGLCAMCVAACRSDRGLGPLPPGDGSLTGTWIQPGIDTWVRLDLSQSGGRVVGYYRTGSANFGGSLSDPIGVTGTATLPQATLQWTQSGVQRTMNATLSGDGDSLTGTWSTPGQTATPFFRFQRSPQ